MRNMCTLSKSINLIVQDSKTRREKRLINNRVQNILYLKTYQIHNMQYDMHIVMLFEKKVYPYLFEF